MPNILLGLSQQLLLAVKSNTATEPLQRQLAEYETAELGAQLTNDDLRNAFWINVYNAYAVISLVANAHVLQGPLARHRHFTRKDICIAQTQLSFDDIEHGLLRHSKVKLLKGYVTHPFPNAFEKAHRVETFDNRIHFALNCGGASCPPIRYYEAERLSKQLQLATEAFLETEAHFDAEANTLTVSRLFDWYQGDFGGKAGVVEFCRGYGILPARAQPSIKFSEYSWQPAVGRFAPVWAP